MRLFEEYRYFFYITNDRTRSAEEIVFLANDRCDQENQIALAQGGVRMATTPVNDLVSNWAYMVMAGTAPLEFEGVGRVDGTGAATRLGSAQDDAEGVAADEFATFCGDYSNAMSDREGR